MQPNQQSDILSLLLAAVVEGSFGVPTVPTDFLRLAAAGMENLHTSGQSNTVYLLAKAVGSMRADNTDTLLPVKWMPMGLVEYMAAFFTSTSSQQVCIYRHMYVHNRVRSVVTCVYVSNAVITYMYSVFPFQISCPADYWIWLQMLLHSLCKQDDFLAPCGVMNQLCRQLFKD